MINGIQIDIEKITDEQLYSLRKILPRKDYRYVTYLWWSKCMHVGYLKTERARGRAGKGGRPNYTPLRMNSKLLNRRMNALSNSWSFRPVQQMKLLLNNRKEYQQPEMFRYIVEGSNHNKCKYSTL